MTQVTVKELAQVVDTPVERLLQQMREAGLSHNSAEQVVTDSEKQALLAHLRAVTATRSKSRARLPCSARPPAPCVWLVARPSA